MVYLGVDLHRKRSVVTALAEDGTVVLTRRIASRPEDFQRVFGELELAQRDLRGDVWLELVR
jgi:hypothetical protein